MELQRMQEDIEKETQGTSLKRINSGEFLAIQNVQNPFDDKNLSKEISSLDLKQIIPGSMLL